LQIKPLAAAGFRVVAPDMGGYNLSTQPKGVNAYDIEHLTTDHTVAVDNKVRAQYMGSVTPLLRVTARHGP
jgi:hypothetical protein